MRNIRNNRRETWSYSRESREPHNRVTIVKANKLTEASLSEQLIVHELNEAGTIFFCSAKLTG